MHLIYAIEGIEDVEAFKTKIQVSLDAAVIGIGGSIQGGIVAGASGPGSTAGPSFAQV
jgi:hypothetical protein